MVIDPMNRRGGLRKGDGTTQPPRHYFAMLPYGMVHYHGAPADLRDIPLLKQSRLSVMPLEKEAFERILVIGKSRKPKHS